MQLQAAFFRFPLKKIGRAALRARFIDRLVPQGEGAFGIAATAVKDLAALGDFLDEFSCATWFRTGNPGGGGADVLAGRIAGAGQELAVAPIFKNHGLAAFFTDLA